MSPETLVGWAVLSLGSVAVEVGVGCQKRLAAASDRLRFGDCGLNVVKAEFFAGLGLEDPGADQNNDLIDQLQHRRSAGCKETRLVQPLCPRLVQLLCEVAQPVHL